MLLALAPIVVELNLLLCKLSLLFLDFQSLSFLELSLLLLLLTSFLLLLLSPDLLLFLELLLSILFVVSRHLFPILSYKSNLLWLICYLLLLLRTTSLWQTWPKLVSLIELSLKVILGRKYWFM